MLERKDLFQICPFVHHDVIFATIWVKAPITSFSKLHGMAQVQHRHITHCKQLHILQVIIALARIARQI